MLRLRQRLAASSPCRAPPAPSGAGRRGCSSSTRPPTSCPRRSWRPGRSSRPVAAPSCSRTPAEESGDFYDARRRPRTPTGHASRSRAPRYRPSAPSGSRGSAGSMAPDAFAQEYECVFGKAGATLFTAERIASLVLPAGAREARRHRHRGPRRGHRHGRAQPGRCPRRHRRSSGCRSTWVPSPTGCALSMLHLGLKMTQRSGTSSTPRASGPPCGPCWGTPTTRNTGSCTQGAGSSVRPSSTSCWSPSSRTASGSRPGLDEQEAMSQGADELPSRGPGRWPHRLRTGRGAAAGAHPAEARDRADGRLALVMTSGWTLPPTAWRPGSRAHRRGPLTSTGSSGRSRIASPGVGFRDDAQVVEFAARKTYGEPPSPRRGAQRGAVSTGHRAPRSFMAIIGGRVRSKRRRALAQMPWSRAAEPMARRPGCA